MELAPPVLALVTIERLGELGLSARNERRLRALGAIEAGARHYPLIVGIHATWLAGLCFLAWDRPVQMEFLALFIALQAGRVWVLAALGRRWTTRVLVVPGETLVTGGPYRLLRHPNYLIVAMEIAVLPLVFGLFWFALLFSVVNTLVLWIRIRTEEAALSAAH